MSDETPALAYLDANVFIEAIEGDEAISAPIKTLFEAATANGGALVTSERTLAEVLAPRYGEPHPPDRQRLYLGLIIWSHLIDPKPVSREILLETTRLRQYARLKLPDAIHLATAISSACRFFISRDQDFKQFPDWMEKIVPDANQLSRVTEHLA